MSSQPGSRTAPDFSATGEEKSFKARLADAIGGASRSAVEEGLAASGAAHASARFLEETHPQVASSVNDLVYETYQIGDLKAYTAASCLGHYSDAWSYFAQATRAIVAGELSIARHLLYYSELRSAFSILARQGILIRSTNHVVVQKGELAKYVSGNGTHNAVWLALKAWAKTGDAKTFFLGGMLDGHPLSDWLTAQGAYEANTMQEIFLAVGYDLNTFPQDQKMRNSASYGARWLGRKVAEPVPSWFTAQLSDFWGLLEPVGNSGFDRLDAEFAGHVIMTARRNQKQSVKRERYEPFILGLAEKVGALQIESTTEMLVSIAERDSGSSMVGLALAKQPEGVDANTELLAMAARAFLLARFASAAAADLITKSGIGDKALDFWYANIGVHTGLWPCGGGRDSTLDVLDEIKDDLGLLVEASAAPDLHSFVEEARGGIHRATSFGAVSVWIRGDFESDLPVATLTR